MSPSPLNGGVATAIRACTVRGLGSDTLLAAAVSAEFGRARTTLTEAGTP